MIRTNEASQWLRVRSCQITFREDWATSRADRLVYNDRSGPLGPHHNPLDERPVCDRTLRYVAYGPLSQAWLALPGGGGHACNDKTYTKMASPALWPRPTLLPRTRNTSGRGEAM